MPASPPLVVSPIVVILLSLMVGCCCCCICDSVPFTIPPSGLTSRKAGDLLTERRMKAWLGLSWILGILFILLLLFRNKNLHKKIPPGPSGWFALRNVWYLKEISMLQMLSKVSWNIHHVPGKWGGWWIKLKQKPWFWVISKSRAIFWSQNHSLSFLPWLSYENNLETSSLWS